MSGGTLSQSGAYAVVVNGEEQYSIWPTGRDMPEGWTSVGVTGSKDECLAHIDTVWTDMRPLSLRQAMAADD
ncbi:MbtH family NRPS accessory protein [Streptomyces sp. PTY087I2]|uniref:MbtH family protein n=1 Tax=Streptomyces sp. PTY087I2 TaxID=1819298 RepID=UPI0021004C0A